MMPLESPESSIEFATTWNRKHKRFSYTIQTTVAHTKAPHKILNVNYIFLMRFWGEQNHRTSCSLTIVDPFIFIQGFYLSVITFES